MWAFARGFAYPLNLHAQPYVEGYVNTKNWTHYNQSGIIDTRYG